VHWFENVEDAKEIIEVWRRDYNETRPHDPQECGARGVCPQNGCFERRKLTLSMVREFQAAQPQPDFARIHAELKRAGVTRLLLWQEYKAERPDGWQYSVFCDQYRRWLATQDVVSLRSWCALSRGVKVDLDNQPHTMTAPSHSKTVLHPTPHTTLE
jgi:hypothetical protein